jgi:hypothetical protein
MILGVLISNERVDSYYRIEERRKGNGRVTMLNAEFETRICSNMEPANEVREHTLNALPSRGDLQYS